MAPSMTRRALMLSSAGMTLALAAGFSRPAQSRDTIGLDEFKALSARLTGAEPGDLDSDVAATILKGLTSIGRGPGLVMLTENPNVSAGTVAEDIVAAWYSGVCDTDRGEVLATFTGALVWNALDYTKPFGSCGGETGYWADPPQS
ncbi:sorbitol dehydrogenase family protein [Microvirga lenta]|uniref:sorbitol dehydrogenase family protein n=1 Tax=Microvirga lenta TaxID=2881337 RepID=UPI001CFF9F61|nr:sorbitol dehydrogenase family protein [Microvirga lenta]MCB5174804.1 sorbitol dehydrogenase family protein [Microvirga lenta]